MFELGTLGVVVTEVDLVELIDVSRNREGRFFLAAVLRGVRLDGGGVDFDTGLLAISMFLSLVVDRRKYVLRPDSVCSVRFC